MSLYLGNKKVKINLDGMTYRLNLLSTMPQSRDIMLLSSDNFILRDSSGLYLIPKIEPPFNVAVSLDDYVLKDSNGLYVIPKIELPFNVAMSLDDYVLQDLNSLYITLKESE